MDCSLLGFSVHEIFQARILEWVAIPFSRGSSWPRDWIWVSWTAGRFFTIWATRKRMLYSLIYLRSEQSTWDLRGLPKIRKLTKLITWTTACLTQWNYEPCRVGPPKTDESWWRVLTKRGPLGKGMENHLLFLPWEPHEQYEQGKQKYDTERQTAQVSRCPICYWRRVQK